MIENVLEPCLMEDGLIRRTQQGRIAVPAAVIHLHANLPREHPETELPVEELTS